MKIAHILQQAIALRATDLHLQEGRPPMWRLQQALVPCRGELVQRIDIMEWPQELGYTYVEGTVISAAFSCPHGVRCRLHVSSEWAGLHGALRLLYPLETLPPDRDQALLEQLAMLRDGLVLVTGPTGCGKTTTLWQMLQAANRQRPCHILTLEDPIEYVIPSEQALLSLREYGTHFSSFADGVKQALRQDPDILLVGEMRDVETMDAALTAAETGHLVFSTLHTRSTAQAVTRLIGAFGAGRQEEIRQRLSFVLQAILAQERVYADGKLRIHREILIATPAVCQLIRSGKDHQLQSVLQTSSHVGMRTMEQARSQGKCL